MTYDLADQGGWEAAQTGFLLIRLQPELVQAADEEMITTFAWPAR